MNSIDVAAAAGNKSHHEGSTAILDDASLIHEFDIRTDDMPQELGIFLKQYHREDWQTHPGFKDKTQNWLGAHRMFQRVSTMLREETESYLDNSQSAEEYGGMLSYYGHGLIRSLHAHHGWEDRSYFPELLAADARIESSLRVLQQDHQNLDASLDAFVRNANRTIKLIQLDDRSAKMEAGILHRNARAIELFLARHLPDEEELAVPVILHYRLRG